MICSSAFWKQKYKNNLKNVSLTFFKFKSIPIHTVSNERHFNAFLCILRHFNRQFYCTVVIIYDKTSVTVFFFVSVDKQRFWGLEVTSPSRDTSPLNTSVSAGYHSRHNIKQY